VNNEETRCSGACQVQRVLSYAANTSVIPEKLQMTRWDDNAQERTDESLF